MKHFKKLLFLLLLLGAFVIHLLTPLQNLEGSIEINAPRSAAFQYLGNSDNAQKWSVYVNHLELIKGEDGKVGATRRCYQKGEKGLVWDEDIINVIKDSLRTLNIYNLKNSPLYAKGTLLTNQEYVEVEEKVCQLTLNLYFEEKMVLSDRLKLKLCGWYIRNIFKKNLKNIKQEVESLYGK